MMATRTKNRANNRSRAIGRPVKAPTLKYQPPRPRRYNPPIGLIGCGGVTASHIRAYREMGLNIVAFCDHSIERARARRDEYAPQAEVYTDYKLLLKRDDIEVVDIATHPKQRHTLVPAALRAHEHVLSQKPFVLDLDLGERFVELADKMGVKLAVNQNGRWSPHWSWMRHAVSKGLLGDVGAVHLHCLWSHDWIASTHFNRVHHIVLYDYGIHWFDALITFMPGSKPKRVFSTLRHAPGQVSRPPLLGQCVVEFDRGHANLIFDGRTAHCCEDHGVVIGEKGTLRYRGPDLSKHEVELITARGHAVPKLEGAWRTQGFMGTMGELLRAIEAGDTPANHAAGNLPALATCFAAVVSAQTGKPETVGRIRKAPITCHVASN